MRDVPDKIVVRLRDGDPSALAELFRVYGQRIFGLCRGLLGNTEDAEDATQEIFVRVLEQADKFDGRAEFAAWFFRLAVNHARNFAKASARRATHSLATLPESRMPVDAGRTPEEQAAQQEQDFVLRRLLGRLPLDQRTVLVLREMEQMSYLEIADLLDIPLGTVTSRLVRARQALKGVILSYRADDRSLGRE